MTALSAMKKLKFNFVDATSTEIENYFFMRRLQKTSVVASIVGFIEMCKLLSILRSAYEARSRKAPSETP